MNFQEQINYKVNDIVETCIVNLSFKARISELESVLIKLQKDKLEFPQNLHNINISIMYYERLLKILKAIDSAQATSNLSMN